MNCKRMMACTWLVAISWLLLLPGLLSCITDRTEKADTYWFEDEAGTINTNDFPRLQKLVPFEIMLPKYLPDDIDGNETGYHLTTSYLFGIENELVIIEYFSENYTKSFAISEQQILSETQIRIFDHPDSEDDYVFVHNNVEIWEEVINNEHQFNSYEFVYKGILVSVNFLDYSKEESRKIVKSMIE